MTCATATNSESAKTDRSDALAAPCSACESSRERPHSGAYRFQCMECCTRLVLSTHPNKQQAAVMLAAIARFPQAPGRDAILESVRLSLARRASVGQKSTTD